MNPEEQKRLMTIAVAAAGISGVETSAELCNVAVDRRRHVRRRWWRESNRIQVSGTNV
ncbi:hypothetical protein [Paenibacillus sp. OAS669]|uniref:hypothetical protein n=1 Tax=Paenibacillus sp. OAS669 TaxID=2663821 RepID=UPI0019E5B49A|nr:hypothetical protein [Paenibacillus sp. OAS669]MBE1444800.1 NADH dehydrogenase FAD-containing subunit [Paenibacillus sp. OAS669]